MTEPGHVLTVKATWQSHYPLQRIDILWNGKVAATHSLATDVQSGEFTVEVNAPSSGWLAARVSSRTRDSFFQPVFAHTSPVYVETGLRAPEQAEAARYFEQAIDTALTWVKQKAKFRNERQRREVIALFKEGQAIYQNLRN